MGYYTTNTKLDGSFRSISVRVKRPGLTVRARKGYRGFTSAELSRGGEERPPSAPRVRRCRRHRGLAPPVVNFSARAQFRIRAAAWSRPAASGTAGAFWVVGELDQQTKRQVAWSGSAQVDIAVIAADGAQVATRRLDLRPADGAFTVEFPDAPGAAAGDYTVRIRLRSPVDGELALSDTVRVSVKDGTPLGDAVMWRRGPSTGPQHLRTADPRFRRNERIRLELADLVGRTCHGAPHRSQRPAHDRCRWRSPSGPTRQAPSAGWSPIWHWLPSVRRTTPSKSPRVRRSS